MEQGSDIHELERLRRFAAFMILQYGPEFGYVLERLEAMIDEARRDDPTARALRVLAEIKEVQALSPADARGIAGPGIARQAVRDYRGPIIPPARQLSPARPQRRRG